jgi:hypothetical protein
MELLFRSNKSINENKIFILKTSLEGCKKNAIKEKEFNQIFYTKHKEDIKKKIYEIKLIDNKNSNNSHKINSKKEFLINLNIRLILL